MGAYWSKIGLTIDEVKLLNTQTSNLSEKSTDKKLAKIQELILNQYPYLKTIYESVLITDCSKPDCPIIYANDDFELMTLYPKEEIVGRNCRFLQGKHTSQSTVLQIRNAVREGKELEVEILNYRKDGVAFWNHFLMLPVMKSKKCKYFIAIQKNVTTLKQSNYPKKWTSAEVAMWIELYGLSYLSPHIIKNNITGKRFISLNLQKLLSYSIILRSEQEDLLEASKFLKKNIEKPYIFCKQDTDIYDSDIDDYSDIYDPIFTENNVNISINKQNPSELQYWDTSKHKKDTLFKIYYDDTIFMYLCPKSKVTFELLSTAICDHFNLKNIRISFINFNSKQSTIIYTSFEFKNIIDNETGTIKLYIEEEEKDLLSLTSLLYKTPDPIFVVNGLLHILYSNKAANKLLKVTNTYDLPNASQIFTELPFNFKDNPKIRTIITRNNKPIPVELSITVHSKSIFLFIVRPLHYYSKSLTTVSFDSINNQYYSSDNTETSSISQNIHNDNNNNNNGIISKNEIYDKEELDKTDDSLSIKSNDSKNNDDTKINDKSNDNNIPTNIISDNKLQRTLDKIIGSENSIQIEYFIITFKTFHTSIQLLNELKILHEYYFKSDKLSQSNDLPGFDLIKKNIHILLQYWIDIFPDDFKSNCIRKDILNILESLNYPELANPIKLKLLSKAKEDNSPISNPIVSIINHYSVIDISNTLMVYIANEFKSLSPSEFYNCVWSKDDKHIKAPNLTKMASTFDNISRWVAESILLETSKPHKKIIQKFIRIAITLLHYNNFQAMMAIFTGLNSLPISRLKDVWSNISSSSMNSFNSIKDLMCSERNFNNYRQVLNNILETKEFCIPYMPIILRDLTFINESIDTYCSIDNIKIIGKQLSTIYDLQSRYNIPEEITLQQSLYQFFDTLNPLDEDSLYNLSIKTRKIATLSNTLC